jgi:hypothetical protein
MAAGCKKAYIASGEARHGFGGDWEYKPVEYVFLAWGDDHAPVEARELASQEQFNLQKLVRVSDAGYIPIPLS